MVREIEFRFWDNRKKEMFSCSGIDFVGPKVLDENTRWDDLDGWKRDIILMQYIGLKDKNSKKIYEGDIVIVNEEYPDDSKAIVEWQNLGFILKEIGDTYGDWESPALYNTSKIIGNIYENPELLKKGSGDG